MYITINIVLTQAFHYLSPYRYAVWPQGVLSTSLPSPPLDIAPIHPVSSGELQVNLSIEPPDWDSDNLSGEEMLGLIGENASTLADAGDKLGRRQGFPTSVIAGLWSYQVLASLELVVAVPKLAKLATAGSVSAV